MFKRVTTQVILMVLTLYFPFVGFFIPAYSLNCRLKTPKSKQWHVKFYVYLIFLVILVISQEIGIFSHITRLGSEVNLSQYFSHTFIGVFVIWGCFLVIFLGFELLLLLFAQKTKLNGFNQMMLVTFIMSSISEIIVHFLKKPLATIFITPVIIYVKENSENIDIQSMLQYITYIKEDYLIILFYSVFFMILITYMISFKKYFFGFHMSYYFTLIYAIYFVLPYVPYVNKVDFKIFSAFVALVILGYSVYLCKELYFYSKFFIKSIGISIFLILIILIIYVSISPFIPFIIGALLSFRAFKTYKTT